ncbi:MAG: hypothetical protein Q9157_000250 [Trypethelium eluteriae]
MQPYIGVAIMALLASRITAEQGPTPPPTTTFTGIFSGLAVDEASTSSLEKRQDFPQSIDQSETSDTTTDQYARRSIEPETTAEPSCTSFFRDSYPLEKQRSPKKHGPHFISPYISKPWESVKRSALEISDADQATESTSASLSPSMPFRSLMARNTVWLNGTSQPTPAITTAPTIETDKANGSYTHIDIKVAPQETLFEMLEASDANDEPNTQVLVGYGPETTEVAIIEGERDNLTGFDGPFTIMYDGTSPDVTSGFTIEGKDDEFTLRVSEYGASATLEAILKSNGDTLPVRIESGEEIDEDASNAEKGLVGESDDGQLDVYVGDHRIMTLEELDHTKRTASDDLQAETVTAPEPTDSPFSTSTVLSTLSEFAISSTPTPDDSDSPQGAEGAGAVLVIPFARVAACTCLAAVAISLFVM